MAVLERFAFICVFVTLTYGLDSVTYELLEESSPGTIVGNIKLDARLGDDFPPGDYSRLQFSILTPNDADVTPGSYFSVEESSGELSVLLPIDRDQKNICALNSYCMISFDVGVGPANIFKVITVHIRINDINDNAPVFGQSEFYLNISENAIVGDSNGYQLPAVTDLDGDEYGVRRMSISPATGQFEVRWSRSINGQVQPRLELIQPLDREDISRFDLTVTAFDGGDPAMTTILLVHVDVLDANDNAPHFEQSRYEARVSEGSPSGSSLLTVNAIDIDSGHNGRVKYSLAQTTLEKYGNKFRIDDSGTISLVSSVDRETQDLYYLGIVATDYGKDGREASATVTVYVEDVNDNAPMIRVTALTESGLVEIAEDADVGTFVALLSVKDQDWGRNADITCSLNTADFHLEAVQANKFKVVSSVILDREQQDSYSVEIFCHDHGIPQKSNSKMLDIHVTDVNDNDPIFQFGDVTVHVSENSSPGALVGQLIADDLDSGDNGKISYVSGQSFSRYVSIDQDTGIVSTITSLDRESVPQFTVTMIARDNGTPPKSATCRLTVIVDDVNDNIPKFTQTSYTFVVSENEDRKREVATLKANDKDDSPHNITEYSLSGPMSPYFEINPQTGVLYSIKPLDRETNPVVSFNVHATDVDQPAFVGTANITIYVGDANDNQPMIKFPKNNNKTVEISNKLAVGAHVMQVIATDDDAGQNALLEFDLKLRNQEEPSLFKIDSTTGVVSVQEDLSKIDYKIIDCVVMVKDSGIPSLAAESHLYIVVNASAIADFVDPKSSKDEKSTTAIIIGAVIATTFVLAAVLVGAIIFVLKKRNNRNARKPRYAIKSMEREHATSVSDLDIEIQRPNHLNCDCSDSKDPKPIIKIFDPKSPGGKMDLDRESLGSGEGSTTDSGRGASEEGEQDRSNRHNESSDTKTSHTVFPGADDSIVSNHIDSSFDNQVTLPRRPSKNKNVTFEEDVMVAEISDSEQYRYGSPFMEPHNSCPAISQYVDSSPYAWSPDDLSVSTVHTTPRRTVRNVKAKDRNKRMDSTNSVISSSNPMLHYGNNHGYGSNPHKPYDFVDSDSLMQFKKCHSRDDSSGNASDITNATSTTSGSYMVEADEHMFNC